jgi:3-oxoacyl-[acyl-carrier-protein] synthase II
LIPNFMTSMAAGQVAIRFGAKGPNFAPTTACAASTHAIGDAVRLIQRGDCDAVIAGGSEAGITPVGVAALGNMRATSTRNDEPEKASRPFDNDRDGFVTGEGAGIVILEELDSALERGARIYAEVLGYGANSDAYHITSPSGEGAIRCMRLALKDAGIAPQEIDYINAHGTSTVLNDRVETHAIKEVFGEHSRRLAISSNKSMIGHLWGAAGAVEVIFTILTMKDSNIPPTINYETPDPECDLDYVPNVARKVKVRTALSNSFGFGGANGVLVLREFTGE